MEKEQTSSSVAPQSSVQTPQNLSNAVKSIFDIDPKSFTDKMDKLITNRNTFFKWVDTQLVSGIDYDHIKFGGRKSTKPTLLKAGAEKICSVLGVIAEYPSLTKYEDLAMGGAELRAIIIKCDLYHEGKKIGEGAGGRSLTQDRNDLNKYIKMSLKSAYIDAVIRTFGMGAMFTQDLEDPEDIHEDKISADQITKINEMRIELSKEDDMSLSGWLKNSHTFKEGEKMISRIEDKLAKKEKEQLKEEESKKVKKAVKTKKEEKKPVKVKIITDDELTDKLEYLKKTAENLWMLSGSEAVSKLNEKVRDANYGDTILDLDKNRIDKLTQAIADGKINP
tara:strand:- start:446 stop:1453 length:1008 start_codon:yes stop_codon:yes gene_type:complete